MAELLSYLPLLKKIGKKDRGMCGERAEDALDQMILKFEHRVVKVKDFIYD